jgi:macrolide transport system ATP-binding/permease protein
VPRLEFRQVGRVFGEDPPITALRDVDLSIDAGAYVAIEGPSGSGKSTLLNQLALIDRPTSGEYRIGGLGVSGLSERQRARLRSDTFGFVFQSFHLMPRRTALENVEVGLLYRALSRKTRRQRAEQALRAVGLAHRRNVAARKLSGGEQQRVAIARAMIGGAPVIVADEPTGNLDSQSGHGIVAQLKNLNDAGATVVLVTHDPELAGQAQQRIRLRDGAILPADAPAAETRAADAPAAPALEAPEEPGRGVPGRASRLRARDLLRESWHALRDRPGRTASLVGVVGVAVGMVVVTLGLAQTASVQVSGQFDLLRNRDVSIAVPTAISADPDRAGGV